MPNSNFDNESNNTNSQKSERDATSYKTNKNNRDDSCNSTNENKEQIIDFDENIKLKNKKSVLKNELSTTLLTISGIVSLAFAVGLVLFVFNMAYMFIDNTTFNLTFALLFGYDYPIRTTIIIILTLPALAMGAKFGTATFIISLLIVLPAIVVAAMPMHCLMDLIAMLPNNKISI
ncbi:MAG: hypothetical protein FWF56_01315 [Firmicutes bacterium]|nr:hypothetical protein [Bacillota bacterium]